MHPRGLTLAHLQAHAYTACACTAALCDCACTPRRLHCQVPVLLHTHALLQPHLDTHALVLMHLPSHALAHSGPRALAHSRIAIATLRHSCTCTRAFALSCSCTLTLSCTPRACTRTCTRARSHVASRCGRSPPVAVATAWGRCAHAHCVRPLSRRVPSRLGLGPLWFHCPAPSARPDPPRVSLRSLRLCLLTPTGA